ncbi:hypothetical protein [Streptomyces sp. NPDC056242]|uniref:hypothetical protein n=1 Tax=Streptomyces sp. NPDC056242 TaxID=3345760 RepID=UPI0035D8A40A
MTTGRVQNAATDRTIEGWLAQAHPVPERAIDEWSAQGLALLPMGRTFAAVRIPAVIVHAAVGTDNADQVAGAFAELLDGPVIHDSSGALYYALIQWHAGVIWDQGDDVPCLALAHYLGVPRMCRQDPPGSYWTVPPRFDGDLCAPASVAALVAIGRDRIPQD